MTLSLQGQALVASVRSDVVRAAIANIRATNPNRSARWPITNLISTASAATTGQPGSMLT